MIERFYLKDYLSFREVELNLEPGLVVFTGPSGSGKSILINSILSSFGVQSCEASLCESSTTWELSDEAIDNEEINVFKHIKKEKSRYFINSQSLSKKAISHVASNYLRHLSLKDFSDFENSNLLSILDNRIALKKAEIVEIKNQYQKSFYDFNRVADELKIIEDEERRIVELKEFASFEIQKIDAINPYVGEDEELMKIKKELSKKEKVLEGISTASKIFELEYDVSHVLDFLDVESSFFDDAMNELRAVLESAEERFVALDDIDVEEVLNRLESLSELKRRYGGIQEALDYKEEKVQELKKYENIEITKGDLEKRYTSLQKEIFELANTLTGLREEELAHFTQDLNIYLQELYLRGATLSLQEKAYTKDGRDEVILKLNDTDLGKISTGEFNRLRLAVLALKSRFMSTQGGILMLDEIDANLSGEESMSVAKVLRQLSKHFQIFVISHQPQLTSMGDQHFLVHKKGDESFVRELEIKERVEEIARIISGENITNEARTFAKELLETNKR